MELRYKDKVLPSNAFITGTNPATQDLINAPIGCIMVWAKSAEEIPEGWHICDGEDGTLDLRDKFMLGASESHPVGETGGSEEVMLTVEQMPEHKHNISVNQNNSSYQPSATGNQGWIVNPDMSLRAFSTEFSGSSQPHPNMPPYLALIFIQKVSASPADYVTEERVDEKIEETLKNQNGSNSGEMYSTEEVQIGTWIDGNPLYRRVMQLFVDIPKDRTGLFSATFDISSMNIDQCVNLSGTNGSGTSYCSNPYYVYNSSTNAIKHVYNAYITGGTLYAQAWCFEPSPNQYTRKYIVILEYTKTTD